MIIEYRNYPESVQTTAGRRPVFYHLGDKLPKKFQTGNYTWSPLKGQSTLYDKSLKEYVIKNSQSLDKPRFVIIAGNDIMRMPEFSRAKIVTVLKEYFISPLANWKGEIYTDVKGKSRRKYHPKYSFVGQYPLKVSMEIHTFPGAVNWDTDNLWIYTKCFCDALRDTGCIPDDNIRYITNSGEIQFIPITREADKKMVFKIESNVQERLNNHMLYGYNPHFLVGNQRSIFALTWDTKGTSGDIIIDLEKFKIIMSVAKNPQRRALGLESCLRKVAYQCIQLNADISISEESYQVWENFYWNTLVKSGVKVHIIN